jgi:TldD protein
MYKVFPDGHEELVRGAEIARIDLKVFKRMLAAGDTPYVLNTGGGDGSTVVAPAMLFEELDFAKIDRDFDKPPILPTPLARGPSD